MEQPYFSLDTTYSSGMHTSYMSEWKIVILQINLHWLYYTKQLSPWSPGEVPFGCIILKQTDLSCCKKMTNMPKLLQALRNLQAEKHASNDYYPFPSSASTNSTKLIQTWEQMGSLRLTGSWTPWRRAHPLRRRPGWGVGPDPRASRAPLADLSSVCREVARRCSLPPSHDGSMRRQKGHLTAAGRRRGRVGIAGRRDGGVADRLADCDVARGGRPRQTSSWAAEARGRGEGEGGGRHAGWEARVSGIRSADRR